MATANQNAQGLVLALFNASAGGNLSNLSSLATTASSTNSLASNLVAVAALVTGKNLSDNNTFRDTLLANLQITATNSAFANAKAWIDGQLATPGADKGTIAGTAVTYLLSLTDATNPYFAVSKAFQTRNDVAVTWSTSSAGAAVLSATALIAQQASVDNYVAPPPVPAITTLTTGADSFTGTTAVESISGSVSALTSLNTFNPTDVIDGVGGSDTLTVGMDFGFTGFTTGSLKNVPNVVLTNSGTISRDFNTKGITGVNSYTLNSSTGILSLSQLSEAGQTINLNGQAGNTTLTIGFSSTSPVVTGTQTDTLTLALSGVGTQLATATTTPSATNYVATSIASIEALNVVSNGTTANFLDASGVTGAKTLTTSGSAPLTIKAGAPVTTFDGSKSLGALTFDGTGISATTLVSVKGGSANDVLTIDSGDVTANFTADGGLGDDTLRIQGSSVVTLQPTVSSFETISLGATTAALTYSGKNTTGVTSIAVANSVAAGVSFVSMTGDEAFTFSGANTNTSTVSSDTTGNITVATAPSSASRTAQTADAINLGQTYSGAKTLALNLGNYTTSSSVISAAKATSVSLNQGSALGTTGVEQNAFTGTITAAAATSFNISELGSLATTITTAAATSGSITTGATASSAAIVAANLQQLTTVSDSNLDLSTGSTLTGLQIINSTNSRGSLTFGALSGASSITVAGAGTTSALTLGALGSSTLAYPITVSLTGEKAGVTLGTLTSTSDISLNVSGTTGNVTQTGAITGKNIVVNANGALGTVAIGGAGTSPALIGDSVTVNAQNAIGTVTVGNGVTANVDIRAKNSVSYTGSDLTANGANIEITTGSTAFTATLQGGIGNDSFTIIPQADTSTLTSITVSGSLGIGTNTLTIGGTNNFTATGGITINASGVSGTSTSITINKGATAATTGSNITGGSAIKNTITGTAGADKIVGGSAADTINGAAGADIIIGGTGQDSLTGGTGSDIFLFVPGDSNAATPDVITDLGAGDIIAIATDTTYGTFTQVALYTNATAAAVSGTAQISATTGVATFNSADSTFALECAAMSNALAGTNGRAGLFAFNGVSYIYIEGGSAAGNTTNDIVIQLTGLDLTSPAATYSNSRIDSMTGILVLGA